MEKSNKEGSQKDVKNMDGNNSEGNDSDKDESTRSECKDETDKESSGTEEEEEGENKDEQNHLRRREIEERKRRGRKPALHVTFSEGEGNSHQSEAADVRGEVLIEEEAGEGDVGETFWKKWKEAFRWNDFFYGLIFGLAPTSWDVLSDLRFGWRLAESGDLSSAGLCYVFVTIPGGDHAAHLQELQLQGEHHYVRCIWFSHDDGHGGWIRGRTSSLPVPSNDPGLLDDRGEAGRGVRAHPGDESLLREDLRL